MKKPPQPKYREGKSLIVDNPRCGINIKYDDPTEVSFKALAKRYRSNARNKSDKKKNPNSKTKLWLLTLEEAVYLFKQNCHYCNSPPSQNYNAYKTQKTNRYTSGNIKRCDSAEILYNGIDRIDSNKDYTKDNCVTCCKKCNYAKAEMSTEEFKDWIFKIFNHFLFPEHKE